MHTAIPNTCLFEFTFRSPRVRAPIQIDGHLDDWSPRNEIPDLMHLRGERPFAQVYFTWDEDSLYIGWSVKGKRKPVEVDTARFWRKDCLEMWVDLRNDKTRRRYTEHCHHFFLLPKGRKIGKDRATAGECREPGGPVEETVFDHRDIEVASVLDKREYAVEARIPRSVIPTYDPLHHPTLGFNYHLNDVDRRAQWWSCGPDFPRHMDPSTWGSVELIG